MDFEEKRNFKRILYSKFTSIILCIILAFLFHSVWKVYNKAKIANVSKIRELSKLSDLKNREMSLIAGIKKLKTLHGVEIEIREKFGVVKEGEELVIIVDRDGKKSGNYKTVDAYDSLWKRLYRFFFE